MFAKALTAAFVALPFLAQTVLAGDCVRQYTIQEGDYCDKISAAQNVSSYQLATINAGKIDADCSNLQIDETICLGYEGEDCSTTYVVVADDTCDLVYSKNAINSTLLFSNNPQITEACDNLYIGQVLCTSKTVQVPPAGASLVATAIPKTAIAAVSTTASVISTTVVASSVVSTTAVAISTASPDDPDFDDLPYCDEL